MRALFLFFISVSIYLTPHSVLGLDFGVFYFGGWPDAEYHSWEEIVPRSDPDLFSNRVPISDLLTYDAKRNSYVYDTSSKATLTKELQLMHSNGISYVIFDWYFNNPKSSLYHKPLENYMDTDTDVQFAILFENVASQIHNMADAKSLIDELKHITSNSRYYKINDHPILFIFDVYVLNKQMKSVGYSGFSEFLLHLKEQIPNLDIYMGGVGFLFGQNGTNTESKGWTETINHMTVDLNGKKTPLVTGAFSYNLHGPISQPLSTDNQLMSRSFIELTLAYADNWLWFQKHLNNGLKYIVPVTSGWDKRAWGGSKSDASHDFSGLHSIGDSSATRDLNFFRDHLQAAINFAKSNKSLTDEQLTICCWNELGEGSYIIPTQHDGFSYLNVIRDLKIKNK